LWAYLKEKSTSTKKQSEKDSEELLKVGRCTIKGIWRTNYVKKKKNYRKERDSENRLLATAIPQK